MAVLVENSIDEEVVEKKEERKSEVSVIGIVTIGLGTVALIVSTILKNNILESPIAGFTSVISSVVSILSIIMIVSGVGNVVCHIFPFLCEMLGSMTPSSKPERVEPRFVNINDLNVNVNIEPEAIKIQYICPYCNQEYVIIDNEYAGFIPHCPNCNGIMVEKK